MPQNGRKRRPKRRAAKTARRAAQAVAKVEAMAKRLPKAPRPPRRRPSRGGGGGPSSNKFKLGVDFSYNRVASSMTSLSNAGPGGVRGGRQVYRGEDFLGSVTTNAANSVGDILLNGLLTPNLVNTRLAKVAGTWQKYRFLRCQLRYEPSVAVTQAGQVLLFWDTDPMDVLHVSGSSAINVGKAHGGALTQVAQGTHVPLTIDQKAPLYVSEYGIEPRLTYQAQYFVIAASTFTSGPLTLGSVWLDYDIEFYTQQVEGLLPVVTEVYNYWRQVLTNNTAFPSTTGLFTPVPSGGGTWTTWTAALPEWVVSYGEGVVTVVPGIYRFNLNCSYTAPAQGTTAWQFQLLMSGGNTGAVTGPQIPGQNTAVASAGSNSYSDLIWLSSDTGSDVTITLKYANNQSWTAVAGSTFWTLEFLGGIGGISIAKSAVAKRRVHALRQSAIDYAVSSRALVPYNSQDERSESELLKSFEDDSQLTDGARTWRAPDFENFVRKVDRLTSLFGDAKLLENDNAEPKRSASPTRK